MKHFDREGFLLPSVDAIKPSRAVDLTPSEEKSLQELLESLLNSGQLVEAERVMNAFGRPSVPVKIITVSFMPLLFCLFQLG